MTDLIETNKRQKLDMEENKNNILNEFEFVRVLSEDNSSKIIRVLANKIEPAKQEKQQAVVIFEKPHFSLDETKSLLESEKNSVKIHLQNDVYNKLSVFASMPYNSLFFVLYVELNFRLVKFKYIKDVEVQLIYPASEAHISKYSMQEVFILNETYEDWLSVTSKYIKESSFSLQWVYNILEHKTEKERIAYEDSDPLNGFVLLPDMKWNGKTESLYMLAIIHQKNIDSLRSLTGAHIQMLENIREKSLEAIESKYGLKRHKIRVYLHYQPSFYHLHIHFSHISHQAPFQERNHQLSQVIENLKVDSDYYKKVSLECPLRKNDRLYELFRERFD